MLCLFVIKFNGGVICAETKQNEATHVPMILLSAYLNKEEDLNRYECDSVIIKPFDLELLSENVKAIVN